MMSTEAGSTEYKGWGLRVHANWDQYGRAVFFIIGPAPDRKCLVGFRTDYDKAVTAGRKVLLHEAR